MLASINQLFLTIILLILQYHIINIMISYTLHIFTGGGVAALFKSGLLISPRPMIISPKVREKKQIAVVYFNIHADVDSLNIAVNSSSDSTGYSL